MPLPEINAGQNVYGEEWQPSQEIIQAFNKERRESSNWWENYKHDAAAPIRIIRAARRHDKEGFKREMREVWDSQFNLRPRAIDPKTGKRTGEKYWNGKAFLNWSVYGALIASVVSCAVKPNNGDPGGGEKNPNNPNMDALCNHLVTVAAANSVDVAVEHAAFINATDANHSQLGQQLDVCFSPDNPGNSSLRFSTILAGSGIDGNDAVLLAHSFAGNQPGDVALTPLLAVPMGEVDDNRDGQPDFELIKFVEANPSGNWGQQADGSWVNFAKEVSLDAKTHHVVADGQSVAQIQARKDETGRWVFAVQAFDEGGTGGKTVILSDDEVRRNGANLKWLDQLAQAETDLSEPFVYAENLGMTGPLYGLPDLIGKQLSEMKLKWLSVWPGNYVGGFNPDGTCSVPATTWLATGSHRGESNDGTVTYFFNDGTPDQEGAWNHIPVAEGWRCVASVAQEGNTLGPDGSPLPQGMIILQWFREAGSKGTPELAPDFIELYWAAGNEGAWIEDENGVTLEVTTPTGQTFLRHMDLPSSLPSSLSSEFRALLADKQWSYSDGGTHILVTVNGTQQDWLEMKSDGSEYRHSDRWLVDHAPNQEWWSDGATRSDGVFYTKRGKFVVPEPSVEATQIQIADGVTYEIKGPILLTKDKVTGEIIYMIFPKSITGSDGWSYSYEISDWCRTSGCEKGFTDNAQYEISFRILDSLPSKDPGMNRILRIAAVQNWNHFVLNMLANQVVEWPGLIMLQVNGIETVQSFNQ